MTFYCFAYWKASLSSTILIIKGIYLSCKSWGQNSYIPWMSQHSCTYFCIVFVCFFYLTFHSQSKFCCFTWFSTVAWPESLSEPSKPCCSPWATTSPPGRTESHLPVRKPLPVCHAASAHAGLSESKGHGLLNELPEWTNTAEKEKKGGKKMQRIRMFNQLWHSFVNRICYLRSFMTSRCFINKPEVAFSKNLLIRSFFQSHRVSIVPAGCSFVVILHTRSALVSAFLIHVYCFGNWLLI